MMLILRISATRRCQPRGWNATTHTSTRGAPLTEEEYRDNRQAPHSPGLHVTEISYVYKISPPGFIVIRY
ncbi:MAG: hypothetical protein IJE15_11045 [Bacteroidaceae bacterium]|nr:hypothetical protein [Bacteroidaceae bacterium]